jgi:hypothetical protein
MLSPCEIYHFAKLRERNVAGFIISAYAFFYSNVISVSLFKRQSTVLHLGANVDIIREAIGILVQSSFVRRKKHYTRRRYRLVLRTGHTRVNLGQIRNNHFTSD